MRLEFFCKLRELKYVGMFSSQSERDFREFAVSRLDRLCCFDSIAQAQKLVDQFLYGKGFM